MPHKDGDFLSVKTADVNLPPITRKTIMARFAPVVPTQIALELQGTDLTAKDLLGSYHLLLAHDIIDKPTEYQHIYGQVRRRYADRSFIIMDNSIIELGKAMEIKDLLHAADILQPDCIVIPDVMGEGALTRENAIKFVREYSQAAFAKGGELAEPPALMGVLQGNTIEDVMETLSAFYVLPLVEYIGIPRVLAKQFGTRMTTLLAMHRSAATMRVSQHFGSFKGFHLLGFSDNILDDVTCARVPFINGIDSAVPIRAGLKEMSISLTDPDWSSKVGPRGEFWNASIPGGLTSPSGKVIESNLDSYRALIQTK